MKKIYLLFLLISFSSLSYSQKNAKKFEIIEGLKYALQDESFITKELAARELIYLIESDSIILIQKYKEFIFSSLRSLYNKSGNNELKSEVIRALSKQNPIPKEDLDLFHFLFKTTGDDDIKKATIEALSRQNPIPKEDLDLFRSFFKKTVMY
jgi:hypothetical protein